MASKAFKECGVFNAVYGTEDEMLWAVKSNKKSSDSDDSFNPTAAKPSSGMVKGLCCTILEV